MTWQNVPAPIAARPVKTNSQCALPSWRHPWYSGWKTQGARFRQPPAQFRSFLDLASRRPELPWELDAWQTAERGQSSAYRYAARADGSSSTYDCAGIR